MDYQIIVQQANKHIEQAVAYFSNRDNANKAKKFVALSVAAYIITKKLYQGFFGPLSHVPGPFVTRFFTLPKSLLSLPQGTLFQKYKYLHGRYGNVLRLGPSTVSVADKDLAKQVLLNYDLPKGKVYKFFQRNGKPTLFSATDKDWHKNRRRVISPAFSIKYLNSLEHFMTQCTGSLVNRIDHDIEVTKDREGYGTVDVWSLCQRLALDVIGETAFGKSFDMVQNNDHPIPDAIAAGMRNSTLRLMFPLLSRFMIKKGEDPDKIIKGFLGTIIDERLKDPSKERNDILQILINSQNSKDKDDHLTPDAIIEETVLFLIAGSETTSNTLGFTFYELLRNPDKLKKLYEEIDALEIEDGSSFYNDQLKHLPYLNAVINETLRLDPVVASALQREAPKTTVLGNMVLPKNTQIYVNVLHLHTNEAYWEKPFEYVPERWLEPSESNELDAFVPFSLGSRNCIGKNFAIQEMRLAIATILKFFEIQSIPSEMEDGKVRRQFVTQRIAKNSFSLKIKRRN